MRRRTRVLVAALARLPKPEPPTARYLARVRHELPGPVARLVLGRPAAGVRARDLTVPVAPGHRRRVRLYRPATPGRLPLVVNFHGGGFVYGNLGVADWLCSQVAARAGVVVASVDYRLAPEWPAPTPFADCWAATRWLRVEAAGLGADPERVSVLGESAGGNLAALVALAERDARRADPGVPALAHQVLLYPITDLTLSSPSVARLTRAPVLPRRSLDWFGRRYLPEGGGLTGADGSVSPLHASDHRELAPALLVAAGQDPLHDDAVRYAAALRAAGVPVRLVDYPDALHGFAALPRFEPHARAVLDEIEATLREG